MSTTPAPVTTVNGVATPTPVSTPVSTPAAVAPKLNAIQRVEAEIVNFVQQRERAIANVHAIDGAIQGAQHILAMFKSEAAKAEAEAKKLFGIVETDVKDAISIVETEAKKVEAEAIQEVTEVVNFVKDRI